MIARACVLATAIAAVALSVEACGADNRKGSVATTSPASRAVGTTKPRQKRTAREASDDRGDELTPPLAFHLQRRALLRARPGGRALTVLTTKTVFKSPRILAVVRRKPGWVAVRTEALRAGKIGWIPSDSGRFFSQPRTIEVDLSKRQLTVRHRGTVSGRYRVAIGTQATPTPQGFFAVTDRLRTGTNGSGPYGCCILALTAHQPKIAQGWGGGDRIAIHATPATWTLGKAVSHGCVRASNKALRLLMRQVRLGTPVRIHA